MMKKTYGARIGAALLCLCLFTGCAVVTPPAATETSEAPRPSEATAETTAPETEPEPPETIDPAADILAGMTLEEKVGQLFLARCPEENAISDLKTYHLGGYLLFARDFEGQSWDSMTAVLDDYRAAAEIPPLLAVDEEGGTVCRVSRYPAFRKTPFSSPREAYAQGGMDGALEQESEKAALLAGLGLNVLMGPVCDIADEPDSFLYKRSLGQSPEVTGQFVAGAVERASQMGVGSVLKHFPGYGNNADTHTGVAVDHRSLESLEGWDLLPFQAGIAAGAGAVLVSHTIVTALEEDTPASLSPEVHRYLREEMGFSGVIMTDDLSMQAITDLYGSGEAAVLAVLAGNDILCSTEYATQYEAVLEAAESGRISEDTLNSAVYRVLAWKQTLGLMDSAQ